ncbi:GGDEF domain-containing protein [Pseudoneobacillus sp. C159]
MKENDFVQFNYQIMFSRLKMVSYLLIFTYPLFVVVDLFLLDNVNHFVFRVNLAAIHFIGFAVSLVYVWMLKYRTQTNHGLIVHFYVLTYLLLGVAASINSQLLTGNITAYSMILIAVAVIFPLRPKMFAIILLTIQIMFVLGLVFLNKGSYTSLIMKLINSTGTIGVAFVISFTFYSYRKRDYFNQCKIKAKEESFYRLFNMNPSPLILINTQSFKIELANKQALDYYQKEDVAELNGCFLFDSHDEMIDMIQRLQKGETIENVLKQLQTISNATRWAMLNFELVDYLETRCLLIGVSDITDLKQAEEELFKHASTDVLTGVMNRRAGIQQLHQLLLKQEEFVLCFIDVNHLKQVNDQKGHIAGDELLKIVSQIIVNHISTTDILFRLGGDEFILLCKNKTIAEVESNWERIKHEMESISHCLPQPIPISASHGLYHYQPGDPITVDQILEHADTEMYKEKSRGRINS